MEQQNIDSGLIPLERIEQAIYLIRGQKVILDRDLAFRYGVETKRLKEQVKRNIARFPDDFMFVLSKNEFENWRSQFATSNSDRMGLRYAPMVFTEQGVAMLAGILNSKRAIDVNIAIMRTFVKLRRLLENNVKLSEKLDEIQMQYDKQFRIVFEALGELMAEPEKKTKRIGFSVSESLANYSIRKQK